MSVSRMVLGGNPFSGFSHQSPKRDDEMRCYYTTARIRDTLRAAEDLGINTFPGRADRHVARVLMEYWDEGGKTQPFAQTCPEFSPHMRGIPNAVQAGAVASYIHGGQMDYWVAQGETDPVRESIDAIRSGGLAAGVAGHTPRIFEWAHENLDVDFACAATVTRRAATGTQSTSLAQSSALTRPIVQPWCGRSGT